MRCVYEQRGAVTLDGLGLNRCFCQGGADWAKCAALGQGLYSACEYRLQLALTLDGLGLNGFLRSSSST